MLSFGGYVTVLLSCTVFYETVSLWLDIKPIFCFSSSIEYVTVNICLLVAFFFSFLVMMNDHLETFPGGRLVGQRGMNILMASDIDEAVLLSHGAEPPQCRPQRAGSSCCHGPVSSGCHWFSFFS